MFHFLEDTMENDTIQMNELQNMVELKIKDN